MSSILEELEFDEPITSKALKELGFNLKMYTADLCKENLEEYSNEDLLKKLKDWMYWEYTIDNYKDRSFCWTGMTIRYWPNNFAKPDACIGFCNIAKPDACIGCSNDPRRRDITDFDDIRGKLTVIKSFNGRRDSEATRVSSIQDIKDQIKLHKSLYSREIEDNKIKKDSIDIDWNSILNSSSSWYSGANSALAGSRLGSLTANF